jgi:hypothetical protein
MPSLLFSVSLFLAFLADIPFGSWQWLMSVAGPFLIVQAIGGLLGLGSLVFITRRFLSTDFPAAMNSVYKKQDEHTKHIERLDFDIRKLAMDFVTLSERHSSLDRRVDRMEEREERLDLDDTRSRRRNSRRETNGE